MFRIATLAIGAFLISVALVSADDRVPLPPADAIEKTKKLVHELFRDEFRKATTPKTKAALAALLFKQAEETKDDRAGQYVLLLESAELASAGGDGELALKAIDGIRTRFTGVKPETMEALFKTLAARATKADDNFALTSYLLQVADDAIVADDLEAAGRLIKMAVGTSLKSSNVKIANLAATRNGDIELLKKDSAAAKTALATLDKRPNDIEASTIAGKYYCFQKGDWTKGLVLLAAGDDGKLKEIAKKEIADPKDPAELLAVADAWYDHSLATTDYTKRGMQSRAYQFYVKAAGDLTGLSKKKAETRIAELVNAVEVRVPYDELWAAIRAAGQETKDLEPLGGFISRKVYRDTAPSGGVLIGFNYTTKSLNGAHDIMDFMQPIYLTPTGEKKGEVYGKLPATFKTVKAKTGYAVGSIRVSGGGLLGGVGLIYMRIDGKGLNPTDKYESEWLGRDVRPQDQPVVGDGRVIIGIHGKLRADGDEEICSIAPIVVGTKPKK